MEATESNYHPRWMKLKASLDELHRFPRESALDLYHENLVLKQAAFNRWKAAEVVWFGMTGQPVTEDLPFLHQYHAAVNDVAETVMAYSHAVVRCDSARVLSTMTPDTSTEQDHIIRILATSKKEWESASNSEKALFGNDYMTYCRKKNEYRMVFVNKNPLKIAVEELEMNPFRMRAMKEMMIRTGALETKAAPNHHLCLYMPN